MYNPYVIIYAILTPHLRDFDRATSNYACFSNNISILIEVFRNKALYTHTEWIPLLAVRNELAAFQQKFLAI